MRQAAIQMAMQAIKEDAERTLHGHAKPDTCLGYEHVSPCCHLFKAPFLHTMPDSCCHFGICKLTNCTLPCQAVVVQHLNLMLVFEGFAGHETCKYHHLSIVALLLAADLCSHLVKLKQQASRIACSDRYTVGNFIPLEGRCWPTQSPCRLPD